MAIVSLQLVNAGHRCQRPVRCLQTYGNINNTMRTKKPRGNLHECLYKESNSM